MNNDDEHMAARAMTLNEAVTDFHALYVLDERSGRLRALEEYQRRFPGFEHIIHAEYALLSGAPDALQAERLRTADWAPSDAGLESGREIGPYRLVRMLGRGAQGTVYLAEHRQLHCSRALKVLANAWLFSSGHRARFEREARTAARLDHPAICGVHDFGRERDLDYIAMRYVEGHTLSNALGSASERWRKSVSKDAPAIAGPEPRLPLRPLSRVELHVVLAFFQQAAAALQVAHDAGIIHRDVKPGNIMVTPSLTPVLLDFGLARVLKDTPDGVTRTGDLIGTRGYMAPEQILGVRDVDARVDVYALGVVLYECLTLTRPQAHATEDSLVHAVRHDSIRDVRSLNPSLSRDIAIVVTTALQTDRERRYRTARDLEEDLGRVIAGEPILARPLSWRERCVRWGKRHAGVLVTIVAIASTLVLLVAISWGVLLYEERNHALERERRAAERVAFEAKIQATLERAYVLPGSINLHDRVRDSVDTLRSGGVDLAPEEAVDREHAATPSSVAMERGNATRTLWLAFQLVEDIDSLRDQHDTRTSARAHPAPDELAGLRAAVARFLDDNLDPTSVAVWRAYESHTGTIAESTTSAALASSALLPRLMLTHLAWSSGDAGLAERALSDDVLEDEDRTLRRLALMERGTVQFRQREFADARRSFEMSQWSASRPNVFDHLNLARVAAAELQSEVAQAHLRRALELEPNNAICRASLAEVLTLLGDVAAAEKEAWAAIDADPRYAPGHFQLGQALMLRGREADALDSLNEALVLSDHSAAMEERVETALAWTADESALFGHITDLQRDIAPSAFWLAVQANLQLSMGNVQDALALAESGLAVTPDHLASMVARAQVYLLIADADTALAAFDSIVALHPDSADAHSARAQCLDRLQHTDAALDALFEAVRLSPRYWRDLSDYVTAHGELPVQRRVVLELDERDIAVPIPLSISARSRLRAARELRSVLEKAASAPSDPNVVLFCSTLANGRQSDRSTVHGAIFRHSHVASMAAQQALRDVPRALRAALGRADAAAVFVHLSSCIEALPEGAVRALAQAHSALATDDYEEAAERFTEWSTLSRSDAGAQAEVVDLLLRYGESHIAVGVVDHWDVALDPILRTLAARSYLAAGRITDALRVAALEPQSRDLTLVLSDCQLRTGAAERTIQLLDGLRPYQQVLPEALCLRARALAALGDSVKAEAVLHEAPDVARTPALSALARELVASSGRDLGEELAAVEALPDGVRLSQPLDAKRATRLSLACDDGLALLLARACAQSLSIERAPDAAQDIKAAEDPTRTRGAARSLALEILEHHLAWCRLQFASSASADELRDRCRFELRGVLTAPEFAPLRDRASSSAEAVRSLRYFDEVRRTLGTTLRAL